MNLKKHAKPLLLGIGILSIFSLALVDNSRNRFNGQADESGVGFGGAGGPPAFGKPEWTWYDIKYRLIDRFDLRKQPHVPGVLIARIDDASLERFGRWPWSRSVYSAILDYLYEMGAEVVAFDAVFAEHEFQERYLREYLDWKGDNFPQSIAEKIKADSAGVDTIVKELPLVGNQVFGSSVHRHPKTVLGYFWQAGAGCGRLYDPNDPAMKEKDGKVLTREEAVQAGYLHVDGLVDSLSSLTGRGVSVEGFPSFTTGKEGPVLLGSCPTVNRNEISAKSKYQGFFSAISDADGIFRRLPLLTGFLSSFVPKESRDFLPPEWFERATYFPSLSLEAVAAYWGVDKPKLEVDRDPGGRYRLKALVFERPEGNVRVETHADGTIPVNFYGTQKRALPPIGEFSLANIQGQLTDPKFQDAYGLDPIRPLSKQIVFIGPTALGVYDLRPNPVQGDAPGVNLHATVAARILEHARNPASHVSVSFAGLKVQLAILWTLGLLLLAWLMYSRALRASLGAIGLIVVFLGVDLWLFATRAEALDSVTLVSGMGAVFLGIFAFKYFTEEQDRAFVKGAFEKYVSPDLVDQIVADPKKLNLGGRKAELSVLFSDVRGFTTISEKMDAAGLARFMNEYLSPMTDLVQANKGTIDKYMGDAIMAIFGAPIEYPEHAEKAVDAGLDMLAKLPELVKAWEARGLPPIDIGIGVNTGEMSVGNMGSSRIFSYTVMGDSVNLGSRLEGINKEYGTNLIVSEFTRAKLPPAYLCRELDRVKVKGKKLPVTIFEVMGKGDLPQKAEIRAKFEEGLRLYYAANFEAARAIFDALKDRDKTSAIYLERCDYWKEHPPEADWDGSWTMKTK